jgi:hypothetical protein
VLKFDQVAIPTSNPKNTTVDWLRVSDTKEVWEEGIKRFGPDWHLEIDNWILNKIPTL